MVVYGSVFSIFNGRSGSSIDGHRNHHEDRNFYTPFTTASATIQKLFASSTFALYQLLFARLTLFLIMESYDGHYSFYTKRCYFGKVTQIFVIVRRLSFTPDKN